MQFFSQRYVTEVVVLENISGIITLG